MGDPRRCEVFAKNIFYKFPPQKYKTILVVADGDLSLSKHLQEYGYHSVIVYEPKPRPKAKKTLLNLTLISKWFCREEKIKADVIVGMHPDEATVEILQWARSNKKPFAVVPCCILGDIRFTMNCHKFKDWIDRLKRINENTEIEILNINGKSTMLYSLRK